MSTDGDDAQLDDCWPYFDKIQFKDRYNWLIDTGLPEQASFEDCNQRARDFDQRYQIGFCTLLTFVHDREAADTLQRQYTRASQELNLSADVGAIYLRRSSSPVDAPAMERFRQAVEEQEQSLKLSHRTYAHVEPFDTEVTAVVGDDLVDALSDSEVAPNGEAPTLGGRNNTFTKSDDEDLSHSGSYTIEAAPAGASAVAVNSTFRVGDDKPASFSVPDFLELTSREAELRPADGSAAMVQLRLEQPERAKAPLGSLPNIAATFKMPSARLAQPAPRTALRQPRLASPLVASPLRPAAPAALRPARPPPTEATFVAPRRPAPPARPAGPIRAPPSAEPVPARRSSAAALPAVSSAARIAADATIVRRPSANVIRPSASVSVVNGGPPTVPSAPRLSANNASSLSAAVSSGSAMQSSAARSLPASAPGGLSRLRPPTNYRPLKVNAADAL